MELLWIPISIAAALMQTVRTAGQRRLNAHLSTLSTTYVRSLFGLPILLAYLAFVVWISNGSVPPFPPSYLLFCMGAALAQVAATWLLIYLFTLRNFAVGSMLPKSDLMMTAILGSSFFSETISSYGWLAIIMTLGGVLLATGGKTGASSFSDVIRNPVQTLTSLPAQIGLATGLAFTFSYLFLREASLSMALPFLQSAAWTVVCVTLMQVVIIGGVLIWREPGAFVDIWRHRAPGTFIGITSALGSIGWFTAMTLQNASYVRAVGQIEAVFALMVSCLYFKERTSRSELTGIALICAAVLIFLL